MLEETYRMRRSVGVADDPDVFEVAGERFVAVRVHVGDEQPPGEDEREVEEW